MRRTICNYACLRSAGSDEEIAEAASRVAWPPHIQKFQRAVAILTKGTATAARRNLSMPQGVVDMWESIREMTSTHNVVFETADYEVSAHDLILVAASPVLKAMLDSTMTEGSSKRIPVKDSSGSGVRLFVDMLYTSSTRDEPDYKAVLVALDPAHRWQVESIVPVLVGILTEMVAVDSFAAIAEAAMLKGLESLQSAGRLRRTTARSRPCYRLALSPWRCESCWEILRPLHQSKDSARDGEPSLLAE